MMRSLLYVSALALVCVVAIWAYRVINDTQDLASEVEALHSQIAREREAIAVLHAEWAWLNRPERLDRLVAAHAEELGLAPLTPLQFAEAAAVAFQPPPPREPGPAPAPAVAPLIAALAAPFETAPAPEPAASVAPPAIPALAAAETPVTLAALAGADAVALGISPPPPRPVRR
ncbi:cell division protein FtsL [Albimonas sp. CAU 1670]|uniref:cell division protein FtsL n=1 Tax=Albimonas sp. CAU 1670 TaxID=3032599 RepID=UPI0023DBD949|nr:cell division protein FtsL [Albimonas sp. CAU 1670]MDF2234007.1 cell division protein FtsL [Albimonas sp. CAU 1670]